MCECKLLRRWFWIPLTFLWIIFPALSAAAQPADEGDGDRTLSPYFFIWSDNPEVDPVPLLSTTVDVTIAGVIADVSVIQTYKNNGKRPIEALYIFPASTRAAVYGMKMTVGDRVTVAEIREREQARLVYETAKTEGKSASLLEQQRPNVFQMNVANIMPGDRIRVELRYTELLVPNDGVYEFVYPTVVGPRYSEKRASTAPKSEGWLESPYRKEGEIPLSIFDINVRLAAGLPIREIVSPSHKTHTSYDGLDAATVVSAPEEKNGGNRDFILRYRLSGDRIETGLLLSSGLEENFFLLMAQPPRRVVPEDIPPREYIFIMDVSGSMNGFPIETSKTLLRNLLMRLRETDSFNVLFFSGGNWALSEKSLPATEKNIHDALEQIDRQNGSGGTRILSALQSALKLPSDANVSRTIVCATDGYVAVEEKSFDLIRSSLGEANFFAFGIGNSINRHLIEGMAHVGRGEPFVVTKPEEADDAATRFIRYIESPVLTGIRIGYESFDAYDIEPEAVPDMFARRPVIVFGKWRGPVRGAIEVTGHTAAGPFQRRVELSGARSLPLSSALQYLWARDRVRSLDDYGGSSGFGTKREGTDNRKQEVTRLGLKYSLMTPYTSFVAVDQVVRNDTVSGKTETVQQPLPMPLGVPNSAINSSMVSEFKLILSPVDAEMGRGIGQVQILTKSGANRFHGSTSAFFSDEAVGASDYFSGLRPSERFVQSGFTLSGPIIKNRAFFFVSYQYTRDDRGRVYRLVLPTEEFRLGDFSAADTTVYDPATGNPDGSGREPFPDNRIPQDRISPIAQNILDLLPQPTLADAAPGQVNYEATGVHLSRTHSLNTSVSWNLDDRNRFTIRLNLARPEASTPALLEAYGGPANGGRAGSARRFAGGAGVNYTSSIRPTLLFEFRIDWSQNDRNESTPIVAPGLAADLGIPGGDASDIAMGAPSIGIDGFSAPLLGFSADLPRKYRERIFHAGTSISKVRGRHSLKIGAGFHRKGTYLFGSSGDAGPRGGFRFSSLQTADAGDVFSQSGLANAFAGFLLDVPDSIERSLPFGTVGTRRSELSLFFGDDWRITNKFTLNLGWRYEYDSAPSSLYFPGGLSDYDPATNTLRVAGYGSVPGNLGVKGSHIWILPRVGAAWDLGGEGTTLRGGYEIQALPLPVVYSGMNFPLVQNDRIVKTDVFLPAGETSGGIPELVETGIPESGLIEADSPGLLSQLYFVAPREQVAGRLHSWHIGIDQSLSSLLSIQAKYIGERGGDIPVLRDINAGLLPGAGDDGQPLFEAFGRRASTFTWWRGRTAYDALQLSADHRSSNSHIRTSYTYGRSRDYAGDHAALSTPTDPGRSWGRSDFDRTHAFSTTFTVWSGDKIHLPGSIRKWLKDDYLKDWQMSGSFVAQSGTPVDITAPGALLDAPGNVQRPDMSARPTFPGDIGPGRSYFDTSVFSMPASASWGNLRRNDAVNGPGNIRLDLTVSKILRLRGSGDGISVELQVECLNVTNTPQFANPSGEFGTATFGQVTASVPGSERQLRFGTRIRF